MTKILLIRFSSFGDVLQSLSVAGALVRRFPDAEIHWVTREEFAPLIATHPAVKKVWPLSRKLGLKGLLRLSCQLKLEKFTHVYDAHNNLRSRILSAVLAGPFLYRRLFGFQKFIRRPMFRVRRFLLFQFRKNLFPPFDGQRDLLKPLSAWGVPTPAPAVPQLFLATGLVEKVKAGPLSRVKRPFVALAPSAAFALKRWPLTHWQQLIRLNPHQHFVVLGGPEDQFLSVLADQFPTQVSLFAGQLSLAESAVVVGESSALVSNDTGLLHVAEQLGKPCVALMGPAPFGFPSRPLTRILELPLSCRPCSKHGQGPCINKEMQKCMVDIRPEVVNKALSEILPAESHS